MVHLPQVLVMGPTPVKDDTDMRELVATLVHDGAVQAFCGYVNRTLLVCEDKNGTVIRKEIFGPHHDYPQPKEGITHRYEEVPGLTLEPCGGLDFYENESLYQAAFILSSSAGEMRDHYHLEFVTQADEPNAEGIQLVHRGCSLDRIVRARWEPQKLTTLDEEGIRLVVPDEIIDAKLEVVYTEKSTEKTGRFQVLGVERSILVYGTIDSFFKKLIDHVVEHGG